MRFLRFIENKTQKICIYDPHTREYKKYSHILRVPGGNLIRQAYEAKPEVRNRIGRPRKTWLEKMRQAAAENGIKVTEADNRETWKRT